jgi:hypothetical protein
MAIYNFTIPNFHIASMRSAHSDTLFATTSLVVANAGGGLHHEGYSAGRVEVQGYYG